MSVATATAASSPMGGPDAKKMRMSLPTQVVVEPVLTCQPIPSPSEPPVGGEQSPAGPSSARSSNGSSSGMSTNGKETLQSCPCLQDDEEPQLNAGNLMDIISKSLLNNVFKMDDQQRGTPLGEVPSPAPLPGAMAVAQSPAAQLFAEGMGGLTGGGRSTTVTSPNRASPAPSTLPGATVIAQSPVAQLFQQDDWSWHRNPAAAIRSGGTNKQTPVWKYFVYNKAENLSRCIIGDCTYQLKGPHTSTLACHLKKHPVEYSEFQKLKVDYTRERNGGQMPPSPSSSTSGSSGTGSVCAGSAPKCKPEMQMMKEKNGNTKNISNIVNALNRQAAVQNSQAAAAAAALNPAAMMSGLLQAGLNPAGFPFMFNPAAVPTSTASMAHAHNLANSLLQQQNDVGPLNLSAAVNAQFMYKKWRRDERKQRELETKLALMLSSAQIDSSLISNPFFRDFMDASQPKFNVPEEPSMIDQVISSHFARCVSTIRSHLAMAKKVALLVDILRIPEKDDHSLRVCVAAAYLSAPSHKLEISLLAIRKVGQNERNEEGIEMAIQQVINDYDIPVTRVSKIVTNGVTEYLHSEEPSNLMENVVEPVGHVLVHEMASIIEGSPSVEILKKTFYGMLFAIVTRPHVLAAISKVAGKIVSFPLTEPFLVLAESVLAVREEVQTVFREMEDTERLTVEQWSQLDGLVNVFTQLRNHLRVSQNGDVTTIDSVVPTLLQLQMTLEKDLHSLGDLSEELLQKLREEAAPVLDVQSPAFNGTFIQATALNPQLCVLLDDEQMAYAKVAIENHVQDKMRSVEEATSRKQIKAYLGVDALLANVLDRKNSEDSASDSSSTTSSANSSSANLYPDLLQAAQLKKRQNEQSNGQKNRFAEAIVNSYFDEILSPSSNETLLTPFGNSASAFANRHLPPLAFWQSNAHKCGQLAEMATELLSVPATTLSLERIFSQSGEATPIPGAPFDVHSHSLKGNLQHLERDIMLRFNKSLLPRTF